MLPFKEPTRLHWQFISRLGLLLILPLFIQAQQTIRSDGISFQTTLNLTPNLHKSAEDYIHFYQKFISGLRGGECPMFPSCSNYALQAINQKGIVKGVIAGTDRLLRCGHEHAVYPITLQQNGFKLLDPVTDSSIQTFEYHSSAPYYSINLTETDSTRQLISLLINESLHQQALVEIYKYRIQHADSSTDLYTNEFICYNALKQYEKLLFKYESIPKAFKYADYGLIKQVYISLYKLGNYSVLKQQHQLRTPASKQQELLERDCNNLAFASLLRNKDWTEASQHISLLNSNDPSRDQAKSALEQLNRVKSKSPLLAGLFSSIIPGSGYAYAGSYMTGISALIFNGLMSYAAISSFHTGNKGMGVLTGLFGVAFYIGNIQGSIKQARRANEAHTNQIIRQFEHQTHIY